MTTIEVCGWESDLLCYFDFKWVSTQLIDLTLSPDFMWDKQHETNQNGWKSLCCMLSLNHLLNSGYHYSDLISHWYLLSLVNTMGWACFSNLKHILILVICIILLSFPCVGICDYWKIINKCVCNHVCISLVRKALWNLVIKEMINLYVILWSSLCTYELLNCIVCYM